MSRNNIQKSQGPNPDKNITVQIYIQNEKIKSFTCTKNELKNFKLSQLRQQLKKQYRFPDYFDSKLYFKLIANKKVVNLKQESQFVASDVVKKQTFQTSSDELQNNQEEAIGQDFLANEKRFIIKIHIKQHQMNPCYSDLNQYCDALYDIVEIENYIERLKEPQFFSTSFTFDKNEQNEITKRIILTFNNQKNMNEQTILALRIPFKCKGLNKSDLFNLVCGKENFVSPQQTNEMYDPNLKNPHFFEVIGKVYKVIFKQNSKLEVLVDINIRSPIDFKINQILPKSDP